MSALLEAQEVTVHFGGVVALEAVSLAVSAGAAVGLVGPNGAGKTTLFNCMSGTQSLDGGRVCFDGRDLRRTPIHRRARLGIGRTFQRMELFGGMTVLEHLLVAERVRHGGGSLWRDLAGRGGPRAEELARAHSVLELLGIESLAGEPVEALSLGHCRLVELGRALIGEPLLLLLDEPSSGLDTGETEALAEVLRRVRAERATALLLVEHDLSMVTALAEYLYVLDFGRLIAEGPCQQVLADPAVRTAYLGTAR